MNDQDFEFMKMAIAEAESDKRDHPVGAVVVNKEGKIWKAHGRENGPLQNHDQKQLEHAEEILFEETTKEEDLQGGTLYTTLEPCMMRYRLGCTPCAHLAGLRGITRVVIGLLDPNPAITGFGREFLHEKCGMKVDVCNNKKIKQEIKQLMQDWIKRQEGDWKYDALFSLLDEHKSEAIRSYPDLGFNDVLTIATCKDLAQAWPASSIQTEIADARFEIPSELKQEFENFRKAHPSIVDSDKLMLASVPVGTANPLQLKVRRVSYGVVKYYEKKYKNPEFQDGAIRHLKTEGARDIDFAHALSLHLMVVSRDKKLLLTQRPEDQHYSPNTWSASIEHMLEPSAHSEAPLSDWVTHALQHEIEVKDVEDYYQKDLGILAIGLQAQILNVCLFGHARLAISAEELETRLRESPKKGKTFRDCKFLDIDDVTLLQEILYSRRQYHPTSRFRMMLLLIQRKGFPRSANVFLPQVI